MIRTIGLLLLILAAGCETNVSIECPQGYFALTKKHLSTNIDAPVLYETKCINLEG